MQLREDERMDHQPFVQLMTPRSVDRPDLPFDLVAFYSRYEGIGRESPPDDAVRLHALHEVIRTDWKGLGLVADAPDGWENFDAFRIGFGVYFEEIVYVLAAPCCPPGSILAIGNRWDEPFVLAASFADWLGHLERWGWAEPAIGSAWDLSAAEQAEIAEYYYSLNPWLRVADAEPRSATDSGSTTV